MQQTRRGFLGVALAAGFAAIAGRVQAPAPEDLVLAMDKASGPDMTGVVHYTDGTITHVQYGRGQTQALYHVDEAPWIVDLDGDQTLETWSHNPTDSWQHIAIVRKNGVTTTYMDGQEVTYLPECYAAWNDSCELTIYHETVDGSFKALSHAPEGTQVSAHGRVFTSRGNKFVMTT